MAIVLVQTATGTPGTGAVTATFAKPTIPGNFIAAFQGHTTNSDTPGVASDDGGNAYTTPYQVNTNYIVKLDIAASTTSCKTVTMSPIGSASVHSLIIREYSGVSNNKPLDRAQQNSGTGASVDSGATSVTRDPNELILSSCVVTGTSPGLAAGSGYGNMVTDNFGGSSFIHGVQDQIITSTGSQDATMTASGSPGAWDVGMQTFFAKYGLIGNEIKPLGAISAGKVSVGYASN